MISEKDLDVFSISNNLPLNFEDGFYKIHRDKEKRFVWAQGNYEKRLPIGYWIFFNKDSSIKWEQIFIK